MSKEKVYGVRVKDDALNNHVANFANIKDVTPTQAVKLILERYFAMNFKERETIEKRLNWMQHRNRGFRSLTSFADCTKQAAKTHVLPDTPPTNQT